MAPDFAIGIDLGTTNCAMSFAPLKGGGESRVFLIPQMEDALKAADSTTLPSFLYLNPNSREWVAGRWARKQAADTPGRVVHSAKSWLCHHASDRSAKFLPWRSDELDVEQRLSPIEASALLLQHLRAAWDTQHGNSAPFDAQQITITVPASFDAAAQKLTLESAAKAGYPESVRLLEEPQAAFYRQLELSPNLPIQEGCVLVVDVGGGTTDLSLLAIEPGDDAPTIKRIAVSDHLLLGGDNIDLALAHLLEPQLTKDALGPVQWNNLVACSRDIKERCLGSETGTIFPVVLPGRGSGLFSGTLKTEIHRDAIESLVMDGFYPQCAASDRPNRTQAGLREWALPYAVDSAVTHYLAEFLAEAPSVDAILFNGGSLRPSKLRDRIQTLIGSWQSGKLPVVIDNPEPDLAVARGAAYFGRLVYQQSARIVAGAARSIYLEAQDPKTRKPKLVCVLPSGWPAEQECEVATADLQLRLNRPVRFQPFSSTRRTGDAAGDLLDPNTADFQKLPQLYTTAALSGYRTQEDTLPVHLVSKINELGLLSVACKSADNRIAKSWPLEFDLHPRGTEIVEEVESAIDPKRLTSATTRLITQFSRPSTSRDKISPTPLFKQLEQELAQPKAEWNGLLLRSLWGALERAETHRALSMEHEETWLILAGYFLRPGFGMPEDERRIDSLWDIVIGRPAAQGKRIQIQRDILWRRVAGGLSAARQSQLTQDQPQNPSPEWIRMAGSFERLDQTKKAQLIEFFLRRIGELGPEHGSCGPLLSALGLLLNRSPFYESPAVVVPPEYVEQTFDKLSPVSWDSPAFNEIIPLFLKAARCVEDSKLNVPKSVRDRIIHRLEKQGIASQRLEKLRKYYPLETADRNALFGESLPPGLTLAT